MDFFLDLDGPKDASASLALRYSVWMISKQTFMLGFWKLFLRLYYSCTSKLDF